MLLFTFLLMAAPWLATWLPARWSEAHRLRRGRCRTRAGGTANCGGWMGLKTEILPAFYQDSVVLMRISAEVRKRPSVREVALFMARRPTMRCCSSGTRDGRRAGGRSQRPHRDGERRRRTRRRRGDRRGEGPAGGVEPVARSLRRVPAAHARLALQALPDANLAALSIPVRTCGTKPWRRCAATCTCSSSATTYRSPTRSR